MPKGESASGPGKAGNGRARCPSPAEVLRTVLNGVPDADRDPLPATRFPAGRVSIGAAQPPKDQGASLQAAERRFTRDRMEDF